MTIEIFIPHRPKTVLEQLKEAANNTKADWMLNINDDAKMINSIPDDFTSKYDFISFYWENAPSIYGRHNFEIGLLRISELKKVLNMFPKITSEGLELYLEQHMNTEHSKDFRYWHYNSGISINCMYRYGKGRAYFNKNIAQFTLPKAKVHFKYLPYYFAYLVGLIYGSISKASDNNW